MVIFNVNYITIFLKTNANTTTLRMVWAMVCIVLVEIQFEVGFDRIKPIVIISASTECSRYVANIIPPTLTAPRADKNIDIKDRFWIKNDIS